MSSTPSNGLPADLEPKLWAMADKLRGNVDPAEYKHVVLGLIFLKYISDAFQAKFAALEATPYADPEDRDEYAAENIFWVPAEARWAGLQAAAKQPDIGIRIDRAMAAIEADNPALKGVLPQNYGREDLDKRRLGELIDLIGTIALGDDAGKSQDVLGRVYEYFLGQFASAEGKKGGQFYTPRSVVRLLVDMLEPYRGRIYDPCYGSGGMFVQSEKFIAAHGGRVGDVSVYGQESNPTTWRLCKMNLAIRGIECNLGAYAADTFHNDLHPDLRADFVLANPPFNMSDWGGELLPDDARWRFGTPPAGNANYAWVQHILYHLSATGRAGFVLSNGSMSSSTGGEGDIRRAIVEADLVDCMVALPPQLFYNTQIPACLWFLNKAKPAHRQGETLFIDARNMGTLTTRTFRELSDAEIGRIAATYHAWRTSPPEPHPRSLSNLERGESSARDWLPLSESERGPGGEVYAGEPGYCRSAPLAEIAGHGYVLTPGRYVGAAAAEDDGEPFAEKMERLTAQLDAQFAESARLERTIRENLRRLNL